MKRMLLYISFLVCITSCSLFRSSGSMGCPPAAFGAEKINGYLDKAEAGKHDTRKTDPVSGKKTSQAKGIRTGEIEKPKKPTKEQKALLRKKEAERKLLEKQLKKDIELSKKEQIPS